MASAAKSADGAHPRLRACAATLALLALVAPSAAATTVRPVAGDEADRPAPARPRDTTDRPARGKLLVASPRLSDPNFAGTVVLVLEYGPTGAVGVIVNRGTDLRVGEVIPGVPELADRPERLHAGGPVEPQRVLLLVRSREEPEQSLEVVDEVYVTGSVGALGKLIRERKEKAEFRLLAGYAGWGPGQLDAEMRRGDWLLGDGDAATIFSNDPSGTWKRLVERLAGQWVRARDCFRSPQLSLDCEPPA